jgi:hypothetical protein
VGSWVEGRSKRMDWKGRRNRDGKDDDGMSVLLLPVGCCCCLALGWEGERDGEVSGVVGDTRNVVVDNDDPDVVVVVVVVVAGLALVVVGVVGIHHLQNVWLNKKNEYN